MQLRELRRIRSSIKMKNREMKQSLLSEKLILQVEKLLSLILSISFKLKLKYNYVF
jgi:hypothetical protein